MTVQTLINDEVLKPCPFCGREVTLISSSQSKQFIFSHKGLRDCPFYRFEMSWDCAKSLKEATELWNRRATRDCQTCDNSNDGRCAFTEECHECMWVDKHISRKDNNG